MTENTFFEESVRHLTDVSTELDLDLIAIGDTLFAESNDWSFVVKTSALIETAVSRLIRTASHESKLQPLLAHLAKKAMAEKLRYVSLMHMLKPPMIRFVEAVNTMRNFAVHDIQNVNFSFAAYLSSHEDIQEKLIQSTAAFSSASDAGDHTRALSNDNPRYLIMVATIYVLLSARYAHAVSRHAAEISALKEQFVRAIMENHEPPAQVAVVALRVT